ncbi:hypothetical protein [Streptosporangium roseum]|uniref:hypothetical protein n=1 Tax=Streptosporangium roseum TaxID=2001 RepID=UPI003327AD06
MKIDRGGPAAAKPGKRERLVAAASRVLHEQGVEKLLTNTFRDPELMTSQIHRLEEWIDSLA